MKAKTPREIILMDRIAELESSMTSSEVVIRLKRNNDELKDTIYELQMADPHLEFISRVQDVGLHQEWNDFCDKLATLEKSK